MARREARPTNVAGIPMDEQAVRSALIRGNEPVPHAGFGE